MSGTQLGRTEDLLLLVEDLIDAEFEADQAGPLRAEQATSRRAAAREKLDAAITSLVAENEALRAALRTAVDHIEMDALRISHCKDADLIDAARNTTQQQGG